MRRTEELQELRLTKFEAIYERTASLLLSLHEAEGAEGLYDCRLDRPSGRWVPMDKVMVMVMVMLALYDIRCQDFTAKHFWEKLASKHDFSRSYNWVRLTL